MHSESVVQAQHLMMHLLVIFLAGTLGGRLAEKLKLPDVAVFLLIGMALGPAALSMIELPAESVLNQWILIFGACFILFHGGTITSFAVLRKVWGTVTLLATTGVVLTAIIVALAAKWIVGIPFMVALLLGAILASTDPAALVPIFQKFPVRPKVAQTVITESAFTDATGAIMTTVIMGLLMSESQVGALGIVWQFVQLAFGGLLVGIVVGAIAAFLISENDYGLLKEFSPLVIVISVLAAYLLAEQMHASGFMGVFAAGLMLGNARSLRLTVLAKEEHAMHSFMDAIGLKLRMLIFILLGSQVDFAVLRDYGAAAVLIVVVFMVIARPVTVLASLLPDRQAGWAREEVLFFFWTRETGVIAAALIGIVASTGLAEARLLSAIVFVAILATLLVQASTTPWVARKLGLLVSAQGQLDENGGKDGDK
ncbi:cation:proton antiporter [Paenibacillus cremeus]|uniref:Sodium:proton antiporter n=1 Tax=Paenibacillus cremeus TaxID=2163881 RepID=A0A559K8S7_9BACL|nr:sodium:proton antiporter [Paenibacillus cremeus]TVY08532.1 sodium:proton antiporter [Paenibacillus cremeus]